MSKSITVSSVAYVHTEDVDAEKRVDAGRINAAMELAVRRAIAALENQTGSYTEFQRANIQTLFRSMLATHGLIRKVLSAGYENPESIDALALTRVVLEGLYTLCVMFDNPSWVDVYLKDGWKKAYVRFLLEAEETKNLRRFEEFTSRTAPANLEWQRRFLDISDAQVATIENEELATPMPDGLAKQTIPRFPAPSAAINALPKGSKRRMLERFYPEYVFLCSFAHGLPDALLFKRMFSKNDRIAGPFDEGELKETFHRQVEQPAYLLSLMSLMQGSAEVSSLYPADVELSVAVVKAWDEVSRGSLLGRAIWNIRTKEILGIVEP